MIRFGFYFLRDKLIVFDLSIDVFGDRPIFVAALSENPAIQFRAMRAETAIERLKNHLDQHGWDTLPAAAPRLAS
ncbi:MAG: hypothetical protein VKP62_09645 [Candidatus Sericytochromatia bacterium]|nr:hypothetical protein [Candidatus Sericytochromatia bacterium]